MLVVNALVIMLLNPLVVLAVNPYALLETLELEPSISISRNGFNPLLLAESKSALTMMVSVEVSEPILIDVPVPELYTLSVLAVTL